MNTIDDILEKLLERIGCIDQKKVLLGFDGFIDTIAKPVFKSGDGNTKTEYFTSIKEFGNFISEHSHKSASIEIDILDRRIGGNMPNFARTIAALGLNPCCIGMFGDNNGNIDLPFYDLPGEKISYAPAGTATAFEFSDGKIFFAPRYTLGGHPWQRIERAYSARFPNGPSLECHLREADFIGCLNWSELFFMDKLLRSLFEICTSFFSCDKKKFMLFDLCDFSRRSQAELRNILPLIEKFSDFRTVILSLNHNEALMLAKELFGSNSAETADADLSYIARTIVRNYDFDEVVIHAHHGSFAVAHGEEFFVATDRVAEPGISTGAGDNFNAAYAFAALNDFTVEDRLRFANFYAYIYISSSTRYGIRELYNYGKG
jgi:hypothetical protein